MTVARNRVTGQFSIKGLGVCKPSLSSNGFMEKTLLLVPSEKELELARPLFADGTSLQRCGFGPVDSGIETARLLASGGYCRVLLFGIAGTYDEQKLPVGTACSFQQVALYGVGAGEGPEFQTAWELSLAESSTLLELAGVAPTESLLLTVTSAAANSDDVKRRRVKFETAIAEDMEAWSVAVACQKFGVPLTVIRGISNVAGDRDHSRWKIREALQAAVELAKVVLN